VAYHNLATGHERLVARVPHIASPSLAVSPDGHSLLYGRMERTESDLMLMPPTTPSTASLVR
jgi:hypothetical protein